MTDDKGALRVEGGRGSRSSSGMERLLWGKDVIWQWTVFQSLWLCLPQLLIAWYALCQAVSLQSSPSPFFSACHSHSQFSSYVCTPPTSMSVKRAICRTVSAFRAFFIFLIPLNRLFIFTVHFACRPTPCPVCVAASAYSAYCLSFHSLSRCWLLTHISLCLSSQTIPVWQCDPFIFPSYLISITLSYLVYRKQHLQSYLIICFISVSKFSFPAFLPSSFFFPSPAFSFHVFPISVSAFYHIITSPCHPSHYFCQSRLFVAVANIFSLASCPFSNSFIHFISFSKSSVSPFFIHSFHASIIIWFFLHLSLSLYFSCVNCRCHQIPLLSSSIYTTHVRELHRSSSITDFLNQAFLS